jgi:L-lactate dehydrogenase complex protein LldG
VSARETVLARVRAALGPPGADASAVRAEADALLADAAAARPALAAGSLVESFVARVTSPRVVASAERIATEAGLPAAVAAYLRARGLPARITLQPDARLRALDWAGFELRDEPAADEAVAVARARWGIAETGSLVFHTAAEPPPRNVNLITGASGTTDIEGSLVLGAHGPRYLHVVIAGG